MCSNLEDQKKIWDYFQNEGAASFRYAAVRLDYILRQAWKRLRTDNADVLNIGVGDGYLERRMRDRGWRVSALDPDERAIDRLREHRIVGKVGFIQQLPFHDGSFDLVTASEVLEHLDEKTRTAGVREIARVLRPGGWFLGSVPFAENLSDATVVCPCCGNVFHRWGHQASFDLQAMRSLLDPPLRIRTLQRRAWVRLWGVSPTQALKGVARMLLIQGFGSTSGFPGIFFAAQRH